MDEVDGLGVFVELERMLLVGDDAEAAERELAAFVEGWGIPVERVHQTYDSLIRAEPGRAGR